jgi:acyl-coenzyme A thioesterase PaaI-like protein
MLSLQDRYAPNSRCFGCGPKNDTGLRIKSFPEERDVVTTFVAERYQASFGSFVSGGIISTLLDCHGNWTALYTLMKERGIDTPPSTVTAKLSISFLRPTPIKRALHVRARAVKVEGDRVEVEGEIEVDGAITVRMSGTYLAVKEGHPAFHRWE